jgi:hypothetical protein
MRAWTRWQDWINVVAGAWLFFSPWILVFTGSTVAAWNAWILGALVFIVALWSLGSPDSRGVLWFQALLGAWTFVAPWVLAFAVAAVPAWNAWILGAIVFILALWALGSVGEARGTPQRA